MEKCVFSGADAFGARGAEHPQKPGRDAFYRKMCFCAGASPVAPCFCGPHYSLSPAHNFEVSCENLKNVNGDAK